MEILESRKEMFSYILTLLRGQFGEHGHTLPAIDVAGMEHLAWVFDALFYLLQVPVHLKVMYTYIHVYM